MADSKKLKTGQPKTNQLKINQVTGEHAIDLAMDTIGLGKQALIFANTKRSAEKTAEDISKKIKIENSKTKQELDSLSNNILKTLGRPTKQCTRLANCVARGIAFHHAGLHAKQRELIEGSFRAGKIKIIACTPTLAYGLDLPAFRSIIKSLKRYGYRGMTDIPVLEYLQISGRAGRPSFDNVGESIVIASKKGQKEKIIDMYLKGEPEEIYSKLAAEPVLRTYVLSLIASDFAATKDQLNEFFSKTFWAHQFRDTSRIERMLDKVLLLLEEFEFIRAYSNEDEEESKNLNTRIRPTMIGKRIAELYLDPLTANHLIECSNKGALRKRINPFSLLQMLCITLEMRPLLNVKTSEYDLVQERLIKESGSLLMDEPAPFEYNAGHDDYDYEYDIFLNSVKTAMMFDDWINEKDEEYLLDKYNIRPGELHTKLTNANWLLYASEELARLLRHQNLLKDIAKLKFRIKYGAKEELLPLLRIPGIGRVRARKLFTAGIRNVAGIKKADLMALIQLLGRQTALKTKKIVGQDFENIEVRPEKRKGQLGLGKY